MATRTVPKIWGEAVEAASPWSGFVDRMPAVRKDLREAQTDLLVLGSGQRLVTTLARV